MSPDDFQKAWRAQSSRTRVTVDAELLQGEVQRNQRDFRSLVLRRDVVEIGIAMLLIPYWFYAGITHSLPWTWYLAVPALVWVAGFLMVDRMRHEPKPSQPGDPLLESVEQSLLQVEHQIWLLRNVAWWYLTPLATPMFAFFAQVSWQTSQNWLEMAVGFGGLSLFVVALYCFIYWLNQRAVRVQLEPRRRELQSLRASLADESTDQPAPVTSRPSAGKTGLRKRLLIITALVLIELLLVAIAVKLSSPRTEGVGYPRLSPFAAVRWQETQPEVKIDDQWYKLISLDDLPAAEIIAFGQRTYDGRWQMRFEEDLVELLSRMGHPPGDSVKLEVQSLTSPETKTLENVPMTAANRQAIKAAAEARKNGER